MAAHRFRLARQCAKRSSHHKQGLVCTNCSIGLHRQRQGPVYNAGGVSIGINEHQFRGAQRKWLRCMRPGSSLWRMDLSCHLKIGLDCAPATYTVWNLRFQKQHAASFIRQCQAVGANRGELSWSTLRNSAWPMIFSWWPVYPAVDGYHCMHNLRTD